LIQLVQQGLGALRQVGVGGGTGGIGFTVFDQVEEADLKISDDQLILVGLEGHR
jgi:hypothetical protein